MKELFDRWEELAKSHDSFDSARNRVLGEMEVLKKLLVNGFHSIPGESKDTRTLLEERERTLQQFGWQNTFDAVGKKPRLFHY